MPHRCVEPVHCSVWPVERPGALHASLETAGVARGEDRVEFSDELRRLNEEHRLREMRCVEVADVPGVDQTDESVPSPERTPASPSERVERVLIAEHRYEVTHQSTTGRLIDLLM